MDPRQRLFRKAALEKMASPERLDELMKVIHPAGWVAVSMIGAMLAAAIAWSIVGRIPIKVQGDGILIRGSAVLDVTASSSGRIDEILPAIGSVVEKGDVIARISQPDLALAIDHAQEELQSLMESRESQAVANTKILSQLRSQRAALREKVNQQEALLEKGLVTQGTLLRTKGQVASIDQNMARIQAENAAREQRVDEARRELEELRSRRQGSSEVISPYNGRVLELMVDPGNLVAPGTRFLTLEALDGPVDAIVYIPAADGKKVEQGMEVRIFPSTVRPEEFGSIQGEVRKASIYPVTPEGMARVLRNQELAEAISGEGPQIEVSVSLLRNPSTPSGFQWSSSQGPPGQVFTGTLCRVSVLVEKKRPISYVLPIFREAMGLT